ncbi:iron-containing alcohol dehydrogenase [Anaerolineae bacterium CFX9]|nr:iron-containing alcohol dehydrogenase [Anaerolineae bacterium CFX9]
MTFETVFTMDTSSIKVGRGATRELGHDMRALGARRVLLLTDPNVARTPAAAVAMDSLRAARIDTVLYDRVRVEPTDQSFKEASAVAADGNFDGFAAVGGGSVIDTAKAANLYATYPADFLEYVNAPIGRGMPVPGKLKPLIAVPTTAGTGSETTGVAIFDLSALHVKTGIAHRALRPTMGIIDPDNTATMPPLVAACSGLDILCHAVESLTALPFHQRPAPESPALRPSYQGSNPISDIWAAKAIALTAQYLVRSMHDPSDVEARENMLLAATYAGIGFGNSGVHLPHGMSYPVAGMVRAFHPEGYAIDHPLVPHGMSVILNAPAVFRFTAQANPARHLYAAQLMGSDVRDASPDDAGEILAQAFIRIMQATGMPNGLSAIGYTEADVEALADGTLPQHRVTKLSPRPASRDDLIHMFRDALRCW